MLKKIILQAFKCTLPTIIISVIFIFVCTFLSQDWFIKIGFVIIICTGIVSIISLLNRMFVLASCTNISTLTGLICSVNDIWKGSMSQKPTMGFFEPLILIPALGLILGFIFEIIYQLNKDINC